MKHAQSFRSFKFPIIRQTYPRWTPETEGIKFQVTRERAPLFDMDRIVRAQPMVRPLGDLLSMNFGTTGEISMMDKIVVKKDKLLETIKTNRNKHRSVFEEALKGYQAVVIEHLETQLAQAKKGVRLDVRIHLQQPEDQTKEYDRVITMLEMSVSDEITMNEREFAQYVMDDWGWSDQFWASNSLYSACAMEEAKKRRLV